METTRRKAVFEREPMIREQFPGPGGVAQFIEAVRRMPPFLIAQLLEGGFAGDAPEGGGPLQEQVQVQQDQQLPQHIDQHHQDEHLNENMFEATEDMWQREDAGDGRAEASQSASGSRTREGVAGADSAEARDEDGDVNGGGDGGDAADTEGVRGPLIYSASIERFQWFSRSVPTSAHCIY